MERNVTLDEILSMKNWIYIFLLCSTYSFGQQEAVKNSILVFFEGFHAKDTTKMKTVCHEKIVLQSITESKVGEGKISHESVQEFLKAVSTIPVGILFKEEIKSYTIQIDGTMAQVWTPYTFFVNGQKSHEGVNAFTLFLEQNTWKIVHLIDTRRK